MKSTKKVIPQKKLTPKELIEKELKEPNHHITDEELKNLKVGADADEDIEKKEQEKLDEIKSETGKKPPNPYSILGE